MSLCKIAAMDNLYFSPPVIPQVGEVCQHTTCSLQEDVLILLKAVGAVRDEMIFSLIKCITCYVDAFVSVCILVLASSRARVCERVSCS